MLDVQFKQLIKLANSSARTPLLEQPLEEKRTGYRDRYLTRGASDLGSVIVESIEINESGRAIPAKIYWPEEVADRKIPLIVYFHGGGFVLGDVASYDHQSKQLASHTQAAVLCVDYRRAPESRFPAAVQDGIDSVLWAFETDQINIDRSKIIVIGDSAGGSMAISASIAAANAGKQLLYQVLLYPVVDWRWSYGDNPYPSIEEFGVGYFLDSTLLVWFAQQYFSSPADANSDLASPILSGELAKLPSTIVVTAGNDPLRDMGAEFADKLQRAGVEVCHHNYGSLIHNFLGFTALVDKAQSAFIDICELIIQKINTSNNTNN